jgi:hypothetical protein
MLNILAQLGDIVVDANIAIAITAFPITAFPITAFPIAKKR